MTMEKAASRILQRGAAAVELGLLMLPLATLTFGATEFGRALYQYNAVGKTVRDAARHMSSTGDALAARCLAYSGSSANDGSSACTVTTPLLPGLTLSQVTAATALAQPFGTGTGAGVVNLVTVTVTGYAFNSGVPFAVPSFTFGPVSATMSKPI